MPLIKNKLIFELAFNFIVSFRKCRVFILYYHSHGKKKMFSYSKSMLTIISKDMLKC